MKKIIQASLVCLTFGSFSASAVGGFQVNGFLSVAAVWDNLKFLPPGTSTVPGLVGIEPVYNSNIRKRPSFDQDSNVGLQFSKMLREDVSITTQFLARADEEWQVEAIWAFLKWEPNDQWQLRVGRVRTDPYMLSDYVEVGYAYPWVRPPEEVYSQIPSEFTNSTGADARFKIEMFNRDLILSAFYGAATTHLSFPTRLAFPTGINDTIFDELRLRLRDLWSFNVKYGDENFSVRAGYETTRVTLEPTAGTLMEGLNTFLNLNALPSANPFNPNGFGLDYVNYFSAQSVAASFAGLGYQFDWKNVVSMGEIVKRKGGSPIIANAIGWYVMGGYHVQQFLPHITFARERLVDNKVRRFNSLINEMFMRVPAQGGTGSLVPLDVVAQALVNTSPNFSGGAGSQTSVTMGIRWDIYEGIAIKGEFKHVHPDFLSPGLFDVNPLKSVNIYSVALNAVM